MLTHFDQSEATLIHQILPPADADKVAFTKETHCLPTDIPHAHLLSGGLNSFDAFINLFDIELGESFKHRRKALS